jgi:short-subunit dehydrogenase
MVNVAVAGGTAGLGRALTEALLASNKYNVIVLSRKINLSARNSRTVLSMTQETLAKEQEIGTGIVSVDYMEENRLRTFLKSTMSPLSYLRSPISLIQNQSCALFEPLNHVRL